MNTMFIPTRHDIVSFEYKGKAVKGEVRRVYSKPKGHLMVVKIAEDQYRSCYIEECKNLTVC